MVYGSGFANYPLNMQMFAYILNKILQAQSGSSNISNEIADSSVLLCKQKVRELG